MNARLIALGGLALTAVVAVAVLSTWRAASAHPDQDGDGVVTILDIIAVGRAFGQHMATPTLQPTVIGNRNFITHGNFASVVIVNTSDASVVSTVTGPAASLTTAALGTSCDGAYGAVSEAVTPSTHRVKIVDMQSGAVLVTVDVPSAFNLAAIGQTERVLFPCPLASAGGMFTEGSPQPDRAVLLTDTADPPCCTVTMYNLASGQALHSDSTTGGIWLNCANDTLLYGIASNAATNVVRLSDGTLIGAIPGYPGVEPSC